MQGFLDFVTKRWGLFFMGISIIILGAAYFFEYALNYLPCELCLLQRYVYMIIILLSLIAYLMRNKTDIGTKRAARGMLFLITGMFLLNIFLAGHQIGVEMGQWKAFTSCSVTDFTSIEDMPEVSVSCDQTRTLFDSGISFAQVNFLLSAFFAFLGFNTIKRTQ